MKVRGTILAILTSTILAVPFSASAATYYVATTGSDSNNGSISTPWLTIAHAVNTMVAGDTTYVRAGTYNEGLIQFSKSGSQGSPIQLLNYTGESPVIDFVDPSTTTHEILIQNSGGENIEIAYLVISGFEIKNAYNGIKFLSMTNSTISMNWIHDAGNQGIFGGGGHDNVFDRNRINHNGGTFSQCAATGANLDCNQRHGMYMYGQNYTITNNLIYDNLASGIQVNGSSTSAFSSSSVPDSSFSGAVGWVIANNTFAYQYAAEGIILWGGLVDNISIENNIFYENNFNGGTDQGIHFTGMNGTGNQINTNIFFATSPRPTAAWSTTGATEGTNYTQSGNIINQSLPGFTNAPATMPVTPDFSLVSSSPAINAGLNAIQVTTDFIGTTRPQGLGYDIGAYEYIISGGQGGGAGEFPTGNYTLTWDAVNSQYVASYNVYLCPTPNCTVIVGASDTTNVYSVAQPANLGKLTWVIPEATCYGQIAITSIGTNGKESILSKRLQVPFPTDPASVCAVPAAPTVITITP